MRALAGILIALVTAGLAAQAPGDGEHVYQAIRQDNITSLRPLVASGVDGRDGQGQTPLMLAAAFGSIQAVRTLLADGADVRASSGAGLTALHLAAESPTKTRMLLDAGADVNATTQLGRNV